MIEIELGGGAVKVRIDGALHGLRISLEAGGEIGENGLPMGNLADTPEPASVADLLAHAPRWRDEMKARGLRSGRQKVNRVTKSLREIGDPVTFDRVRAYMVEQRTREVDPIGPGHITNIRNDLVEFMRYAGGPDLTALPHLGSARENGEGVGAFSPAEVAAIVRAAEADEAAGHQRCHLVRSGLYVFLWETTTRVGQACQSKRHDFDLEKRVYYRRAATNKTGRASVCPLSADLCRRLEPLLAKARPYVWAQREWPDRPFHPKREMLLGDMTAAGVPRIGPDGLPRAYTSIRKGAASLMAERNVPAIVAQRIFGHSTYATTARHYARVRPEVPREIIDGVLSLPGTDEDFLRDAPTEDRKSRTVSERNGDSTPMMASHPSQHVTDARPVGGDGSRGPETAQDGHQDALGRGIPGRTCC